MKKRIIIGISIALTLMVCVVLLLQISKCKERREVFSESCWENVKDYKITELDDGTFSVRVIAPDYKEIMRRIAVENEEIVVTAENLNKMVRNNEKLNKEYEYIVGTDEIDVIKAGYINAVGNDLNELILETYEVKTDEE